jgi:hypothetical protein
LGLSLVPGFLVWNLAVTFLADLDVLLVGLLARLLETLSRAPAARFIEGCSP